MSVFMVTSALRPDFGGATSVPNSFDLDTRLTPSISFYSKCHLSKVFSFFFWVKKNFFWWCNFCLFFCRFSFFFFFFFTVVQVQLSPFSHHHFPLPHTSLPPSLNPPTHWLCPWVLYTCSWVALPHFSQLSSSLHSGCCQFALYFNISGYILLACLFCWLGSA